MFFDLLYRMLFHPHVLSPSSHYWCIMKKILFRMCFMRGKKRNLSTYPYHCYHHYPQCQRVKEVLKCTSNSSIAGEREGKKYILILFQSELSWKKDFLLEVINVFTLWQKHWGWCILICKSPIFYPFFS